MFGFFHELSQTEIGDTLHWFLLLIWSFLQFSPSLELSVVTIIMLIGFQPVRRSKQLDPGATRTFLVWLVDMHDGKNKQMKR